MASAFSTTFAGDLGQSEKPGFLRVAWAVFVGYVVAAVLVIAIGIPLLFLGVVGNSGMAGADPSGFLGWPYWRTGWWSGLANATVNLGIVGVAVLCVWNSVAHRTGRDVRLGLVAVALLVTGYAPAAHFDGLLRLSGIVGLGATALLVWCLGLGEPGTHRPPLLPPRLRRVLLGGAAMAAAGAIFATASYGITHPLWFGSAVWEQTPDTRLEGRSVFRYPFEEGGRVSYMWSLKNVGFSDATVSGIEASSRGLLQLAGFRAGDMTSRAASRVTGGSPFSVQGHNDRWLTLVFQLAGCNRLPTGSADIVTHVTVHYRVLGTSQSQYVPLVPAPATRCP